MAFTFPTGHLFSRFCPVSPLFLFPVHVQNLSIAVTTLFSLSKEVLRLHTYLKNPKRAPSLDGKRELPIKLEIYFPFVQNLLCGHTIFSCFGKIIDG